MIDLLRDNKFQEPLIALNLSGFFNVFFSAMTSLRLILLRAS
jgi:hypothetical protein